MDTDKTTVISQHVECAISFVQREGAPISLSQETLKSYV